ncbi:MAG: Na/Pi symporter [Bacteroidia bacterium]
MGKINVRGNTKYEKPSFTTGSVPEFSKEINKAYDASGIAFEAGKLLLILFFFLVALNLMSGSFQLFGAGFAKELVTISANPFISLFVGLLATALIQSSSTTTTLIVSLVAAGKLSLLGAVPMIMGANIGTSVTSTIVSLGHIGNRAEFEKAVAGASVHDFFNIFTVFILFPLEMTTHALSNLSGSLASLVEPQQGEGVGTTLFFVRDTARWIIHMTGENPYISLIIGLAALFFSLQFLTKILRNLVIGKIEQNMNKYLFKKPLVSLFTGFITTTAVQSSSVTTSLMVPLIATEKLTLERAFPFIMGANIGTTTTALIAAVFLEAPAATAALGIAFTHLLFNLFGVCILFPIPIIRKIPIYLAEALGRLTLRNRIFGVVYIVIVFFVIPICLIFLNQNYF